MGIQVNVMQTHAEDAVAYVPDFQDNREIAQSGGEPFEVDLMPMSGADYDKLHAKMMGGKKIGANTITKRAQQFVKRLISDHVVGVRGFSVKFPGGETERPSNGAELYRVVMMADVATAELLDDIVDALKDHSVLSEGELGKLRARSGSSQPTLRASETGHASDAADSNTKPETPSLMSESESARGFGKSETATAKVLKVSA